MSSRYISLRKNGDDAFQLIYDALKPESLEKGPIVIGKCGATELHILYQRYLIESRIINDFTEECYFDGGTSGLYPKNKNNFIDFIDYYAKKLNCMDIMSNWFVTLLKFEEIYIWQKLLQEKPQLVDLPTLECFRSKNRSHWWQNHFQNKTILVISPFVDSIEKQLANRDKVWQGAWEGFWPSNITFKYVKFPHPYVLLSKEEQRNHAKCWCDLLLDIKNKIKEAGDFDIALIGAGAYSIPLCSFIKKKINRSAFHLGGGLQLMFGVYGNRWNISGDAILKELVNEHWVKPSAEETPVNYKLQENGCYF